MEAFPDMDALPGTLFALLGGALFYLASPRQQVRAAPRWPAAFVAAGALCCGAGAVFWHGAADWPAAFCATIAALAAGLALMPFAGTLLSALARRRAKLASAPAGHGDASRRTGIQ